VGRPGIETGPDLKKIEEVKTQLQPVNFCFFLLKQRRLNFFKKIKLTRVTW
jgi:hypothetical protein